MFLPFSDEPGRVVERSGNGVRIEIDAESEREALMSVFNALRSGLRPAEFEWNSTIFGVHYGVEEDGELHGLRIHLVSP